MVFFLVILILASILFYLQFSRSYSNSYICAALGRHNKKITLINIAALILMDRAIVALLFYRANFRINSFLIGRVITNITFLITGIEIYYNAKIGYRVQIWHGQGTVIGKNAVIGDDCLILHQVTLGSGFVVLGDRVKVGAGAKILGSIFVQSDSVVGANAVVTRNIAPRTIVTTTQKFEAMSDDYVVIFGTKE